MNRRKMDGPPPKVGASALLQKANAQLRGERVQTPSTVEKDEDDIGAYLSSLSKKTTHKEPQWDKFGEESEIDISISSNEEEKKKTSSAPSKFLKKKPQTPVEEKNIKNDTPKFLKKPQPSTVSPQKTQAPSKSNAASALSKAAQFMNRFSQEKKKEPVILSDSDLDMDLSMDSDVMADVHAMRKTPASVETKTPVKTPQNKFTAAPVKSRSSSPDKSSSSPVSGRKTKLGNKGTKYSFEMSDSSTSEAVGKGGAKFLKKKIVEKPVTPPPEPARSPASPKRDMFRLKSSDKYATQVVLDTDEESLADFIGGLSGSTDPGSGRTPRGGVSPKGKVSPKGRVSPKSPTAGTKFLKPRRSPVPAQSPEPSFDAIKEVEELSDNDEISIEEESFKFNVMGIDSLEPAFLEPAPETPKRRGSKKSSKVTIKSPSSPKSISKKPKSPRRETTPKKRGKENKKPEEPSPFFTNMGLHTVDELLAQNSDISEVSEVPSEVVPEPRSPTPLRSILSPTPRSQTPRRVRLSLGEIHEIRSRSPSPEPISTGRGISSRIYTEDFDEEFTDTATSVRTSDSEESIETVTDRTGRNSPARSRRASLSRQKSVDEYSDDFTETSAASKWRSYSSRSSSRESVTYSDDYTSYVGSTDRSRTPSPDSVRSRSRRRPETRNIEIQTSEMPGLWYHWNTGAGSHAAMSQPLGLGHVDPTPIASHVVSADALEALTAYSPSVIALNDMLRLQLQMTQQFVETQKRLHRAYVGASIPDHNYTTLAETKKYIAKNRKPKLTFKEALRQVKEDMNLD